MIEQLTGRLARIRALEEQRSLLAAEQAREVALLATERRAEVEAEIAAGPTPGVGSTRRREHAERQLKADVGKACRISPWRAGQYLAWVESAPTDTPETFALLTAGQLSERRAMIVSREVAPLGSDDRRLVDAGIAAHCAGWGDRKLEKETRAAVQELDPAGACERAALAAGQRRVTSRPAPETMGWLTALAPMAQVVACRAALEQAATAARAAGDTRTRGQLMTDTLVERVTGQTAAPAVPLAVQLIVTDRTLLGTSDRPARLPDGTPVPAALARAMVLDTDAAVRVRRLFTDPAGRLITAETTSRDFTPAMREFIDIRDGGTCTTDWCDAPIRHADHHDPHAHGGPTSLGNGRGTCEWCNVTKSDTVRDPPAPPPAPTRPPRRRQRRSRVERLARRRIALARRPPPSTPSVELYFRWSGGCGQAVGSHRRHECGSLDVRCSPVRCSSARSAALMS